METVERIATTQDWVTITLVICFILFAIAKFSYDKRFHEFLMLPLTNKYFSLKGKDNSLAHPFNMVLLVAQILLVSLFIHLIFQVFWPVEASNNNWLFIQICTGYLVLVVVKLCLEKIIGTVFNIDPIINEYLYEKLSYRNLIGVLLFILNIMFYFIITPSKSILLIVIVAILCLNVISLFSSYKSHRNSILRYFFYFILYLCALEISPYILLYKWAG